MNLGGFQACLRVPFDNCQTTFECLVLGRNHPGFRPVGHFPMSVFVCVCLFCCDGRDCTCVGGKKGARAVRWGQSAGARFESEKGKG